MKSEKLKRSAASGSPREEEELSGIKLGPADWLERKLCGSWQWYCSGRRAGRVPFPQRPRCQQCITKTFAAGGERGFLDRRAKVEHAVRRDP
jgi:hypothetical protein